MIPFVRLCALVFAVGLAPAAAADSIDGLCPDNPDRIERAICADQQLSANRDRMVAAFEAAHGTLSAAGAARFAAGQEAWLKRAHRFCGEVVDRSLPDLDEIGRQCLSLEYHLRAETLARAAPAFGPYRFIAVERFEAGEATPLATDSVCVGMICRDLRYAQIDAPDSSESRRWNATTAAWARQAYRARLDTPPEGMTDLSVEVLVIYSEADFVSAQRAVTWWAVGNVFPVIEIVCDNRWLITGEPLAPTDLFDPAGDWAAALQRAAAAQIAQRHPTVTLTETVARQVPDPTHWMVVPDGLILNLSAGPRTMAINVRIPWRDLKDHLVSPLPLALRVE